MSRLIISMSLMLFLSGATVGTPQSKHATLVQYGERERPALWPDLRSGDFRSLTLPVLYRRLLVPQIGKTGKDDKTADKGKGEVDAKGGGIGKTGKEETNEKIEQGRIISIPKMQIVRVPPNEGYLSLFTVAQAQVELRPISASGEIGRPLKTGTADKDGLIAFKQLPPGNYKLEITCQDYDLLTDTVTIKKGEQTNRLAPLASKYATVSIALGNQAAEDVTVKLNGQVLDKPKIENGQLIFERVPVGKQTFSISKPNFKEWKRELVIRPGTANIFSETMDAALVSLVVKSMPNAEVYLDGLKKGEVRTDGSLPIPNLSPGKYKLSVQLDGYAPAERTLTLTLEKREVTEDVPLDPITEDAAVDVRFDGQISYWAPAKPPGWELAKSRPLGLTVAGDTLGLLYNSSLPNRTANVYGDFDLKLLIKFTNGKGAAWVVRAEDERNYYLFELVPAPSQNQLGGSLKAYVCRDGNCGTPIKIFEVFPKLDQSGYYEISLEARGNKFKHTITVPGASEPKQLGGVFEDSRFSRGGIGLRAINGIEMFVGQFFIQPTKGQPPK